MLAAYCWTLFPQISAKFPSPYANAKEIDLSADNYYRWSGKFVNHKIQEVLRKPEQGEGETAKWKLSVIFPTP